jgi:hypothetical protein
MDHNRADFVPEKQVLSRPAAIGPYSSPSDLELLTARETVNIFNSLNVYLVCRIDLNQAGSEQDPL